MFNGRENVKIIVECKKYISYKKKKKKNGPRHAKTCFRAYVDEGIRASASRIIGNLSMYEWRANVRMILCACA